MIEMMNVSAPAINAIKLNKLNDLLYLTNVSIPPIEMNNIDSIRRIIDINVIISHGFNIVTLFIISRYLIMPCTKNVAESISNKVAVSWVAEYLI